MTEKQFENKIKKFLKSHNIWFTKIWGGGYQKAGIPDILACVNGRFVAIELKGSSGKPTELQKYNIRRINECNGVGVILYPKDFERFKLLILDLLRR
jgi:Holliday junction resolvase